MFQARAWLLIVALCVGSAACEPAPPRPVIQPASSPQAVAPLVIGAILNVAADAGPESWQRFEAATLAVEIVNRRGGVALPSGEHRPLQLVVYDDAGEPGRAEPALRRLISDGVLAVIGPSSSDTTAVIRPAAEAAGIPLIALEEAGTSAGGAWRWTYSLTVPSEEALAATIDFFTASSVDRLAWLAPRTLEATSLRRALGRFAAAANMQVVSEEAYGPGEEEYTQRLARLQAAEPRVILAWPRDAQESAAIAREAGKVQNLVPIFLGPAAANPTTLTLTGDTAAVVRTVTLRLPVSDDLWDHDALTPVVRDFRREMQDRTGRPPTTEAARTWDAVGLIVAALERPAASPNPLTRTSLRDSLDATTDYAGASGLITFESRQHSGLDRRALIVARSDGRRWRLPP